MSLSSGFGCPLSPNPVSIPFFSLICQLSHSVPAVSKPSSYNIGELKSNVKVLLSRITSLRQSQTSTRSSIDSPYVFFSARPGIRTCAITPSFFQSHRPKLQHLSVLQQILIFPPFYRPSLDQFCRDNLAHFDTTKPPQSNLGKNVFLCRLCDTKTRN